jgi:CelD/BcsL family acetyltransferase involved in cellulose biosynthesis
MTLDVHVDCDEKCFELPEWETLLAADPNAHVFATPEWNKTWWEEFGLGKDLFLLSMRRHGELKALVPLYREEEEGRKILRFIGGVDLTDYLGPICSIYDRDTVAETLVSWLLETAVEWDELDAHSLPVPFGFAEYLVDHADRRGLTFRLEQEETSAVLALPSTWSSYLSSLDSKQRHEIKRKRRRLGREHPDAYFRTANEESLDRDLKTFVEMHRGAEGHKGHFMSPDVASFFERIARAFISKGSLRLDFLEIGDRAVSSAFGFETAHTFYLYNSAYEPDVARLSPGFVLVSELVKESIQKGTKTFDLLRGPERYKYQLGAEAVPLNNVRLLRSG